MNISEREKFMVYIFCLLLIFFAYTTFVRTPNSNKINELESIKYNIEQNKSKVVKPKNPDSKININNLNKNEILNIIQQNINGNVSITSVKFFDGEKKYSGIELELFGNRLDVLNSIKNLENSINSIYIDNIESKEYEGESSTKIIFHNY